MQLDRKTLRLLLCLLVLAVGVRVAYLLSRSAVMDNEGAHYGMMAQHLLDGRAFPRPPTATQPQLVMAWFHPLMIAGVTMITRDTELAARLVSLLSGASLVVVLFFLGLRLYGRATAWIVATLAAFFPILVAFSTAGYSESLYLALLMGAVYFSIRCFDSDRGRAWLWAGMLFGCAYLTRPEALPLPFLAVLFILAGAAIEKLGIRPALRASAGMLAVFALFVAPYAALFKVYTGHFLLEGKNRLNYTIGQRILAGMPPGEAARGIDSNLTPVGPQLAQLAYLTHTPYPTRPPDLARYFLRSAAHNKGWLYSGLIPALAYGSILLWFLAGIGLFRRRWDRRRLLREVFLLSIVAYIIVILFSAQMPLLRYSLPLFPFGLLWASFGIAELGSWARGTTRSFPRKPALLVRAAPPAFVVLPMTLLLGFSAVGLCTLGELNETLPGNRVLKQAGLWLRDHCGEKHPVIMADEAVVPYYAQGDWLPLPYADSSLALRYIASKRPDFVVATYLSQGEAPYADEWLSTGIPDPRAQLRFEASDASGNRVRVYEWTNMAAESPDVAVRRTPTPRPQKTSLPSLKAARQIRKEN